jgi:peptidoglycan/xylan/chitin deacetylase (PgdA/CDA1 family)
MTPFVLFCGGIAVFYVIYRIFLVGVSAVTLEHGLESPKKSNVCVADDTRLHDPDVILSDAYQKRIQNQPALSSNLIKNPTLTENGLNAGEPNYYNHGVENENTIYEVPSDTDGAPFLRVTDIKKDTSQDDRPTWISDMVPIEPEKSYDYGFSYRSDKPVQVTMEYLDGIGGNEKGHYRDIGALQPSSTWQRFTAHVDDADHILAFRVGATTIGEGHIDTRAYDVHQIPDAKLKQGMVSITFDDGWESVETRAKTLLDKYQFKASFYIISDVSAQSVDGYMGFSTIKHLKSAGHEIASHSLTHCDQTTLTSQQIKDNAEQSKKTLESQGLGPITSFAYPLGQYNKTTQDIYSKNYTYIRTSDAGYNDRYFDETNIHSMGVLNATSDETFKSWLDFAAAQHQWVVLVYHRIDETGKYSVTNDQLDRQFALIKQSNLQVLPLSSAAQSAR